MVGNILAVAVGAMLLIFTAMLYISRHAFGFNRRPCALRVLGFASVRLWPTGFTLRGDIREMRITNTQGIEVQARPVDIHGNPTDEYEKGSERFFVKSDDESLVIIQQDVNFPLTALILATGRNGVVQIGFEADGDPGDGREIIEASGALEIVSNRARSAELIAGTVFEQPQGSELPPVATAPAPEPAVEMNSTTRAPDWSWDGGEFSPNLAQPYPGEVRYRNARTGEVVTLYITIDDYSKMPLHAVDIDFLLSFGAVRERPTPTLGVAATDAGLTEAQAQGLVGEQLQDGSNIGETDPNPATDSPAVLAVDETQPSRFPLMGGAQPVERVTDDASTDTETKSEQVGAVS